MRKTLDIEKDILLERQKEVIRALEYSVVENALNLLKSPEEVWQPSDYLGGDVRKVIEEVQASAKDLDPRLLCVLVGDTITEEALPSYSLALGQVAQDKSGVDATPLAKWLRGWTAEENRHGDVLQYYLRLTDRVNMRAVEETTHTLLRNGFDYSHDLSPVISNAPYFTITYAAFQERATKISHARVAQLAGKSGNDLLRRICGGVAGDEANHEKFYSNLMKACFEHDPEQSMLVFAALMQKGIVMPAQRMSDYPYSLFDTFSAVAQQMRVYTAEDYRSILQHFITEWDVPGKKLTGRAAEAQEYLGSLHARYENIAERATRRNMRKIEHLPWII